MRVFGGTVEVTLAHTGTKLGSVKRQVGSSDCSSSRLCRRRMAELLAWTCNERAVWAGADSGSRAEVGGGGCGVGVMGGDALLALRAIANQRIGPQGASGDGLSSGSGLSTAPPLPVPPTPQSESVDLTLTEMPAEAAETVLAGASEIPTALGLAPAIALAQTYQWWKLADGPYREARAAFLRCEPFSGWYCDPLPVFLLKEAERGRERSVAVSVGAAERAAGMAEEGAATKRGRTS